MNLPELSILVVSYNTRQLTLECLRSIEAQKGELDCQVVVVDNDSEDGSAGAIAAEFPHYDLIASQENLGFAGANNLAVPQARADWILLLNPDTVVLDRALEKLLAFARENPKYGIFGGRTLFGDRSLNKTCCWAAPTPWSLFCKGLGLAAIFRDTALFDPESYGSWPRDSVREVDIVSGCFFLIRRETWESLGGFDPAFFMYAEEADLCLRARKEGIRALFTPEAEIIHYGGASERVHAEKVIKLLTARRKLMERHWAPAWRAFGRFMQVLWVLNRWLFWSSAGRLRGERGRTRAATFGEVWRRRNEWRRRGNHQS